MRRFSGRLKILASALATLFILSPAPAPALQIMVTPPRYEFDFPPGQTQEAEVSVANISSDTVTIITTVEDWSVQGTGKEPVFFEPGTLKESCAAWINVKTPVFKLSPNEEKTFTFSITAPKDAKGGYRAVIFIETQSSFAGKATVQKMQSDFGAKIACMIYYNAQGASYTQIDFSDISTSPPDDDKNLQVNLHLKNLGNTHFISSGNALITDEKGNTIASLEYPRIVALQGVMLTESQIWRGTLKEGKYEIIGTIDQGQDKPPAVLTKKFEVRRGLDARAKSDGRRLAVRVENTGNTTLEAAFRVSAGDGRALGSPDKKLRQYKILPHSKKLLRFDLPSGAAPIETVNIEVVADGKTLDTLTRKVEPAK